MSHMGESDSTFSGLTWNNSCGGGCGSTLAVKIFCIFILLFCGSTDFMMTTTHASMLDDYQQQDPEMYSRSNRASNLQADVRYNQLSRALERMHFGPLLRLRSMSNRVFPKKFLASDLPKSRQKKSLSYLSKFYPVLQPSGGSSYNGGMRRRISFPHSSETSTYPVGRFSSRPTIMRLRWGK